MLIIVNIPTRFVPSLNCLTWTEILHVDRYVWTQKINVLVFVHVFSGSPDSLLLMLTHVWREVHIMLNVVSWSNYEFLTME